MSGEAGGSRFSVGSTRPDGPTRQWLATVAESLARRRQVTAQSHARGSCQVWGFSGLGSAASGRRTHSGPFHQPGGGCEGRTGMRTRCQVWGPPGLTGPPGPSHRRTPGRQPFLEDSAPSYSQTEPEDGQQPSGHRRPGTCGPFTGPPADRHRSKGVGFSKWKLRLRLTKEMSGPRGLQSCPGRPGGWVSRAG